MNKHKKTFTFRIDNKLYFRSPINIEKYPKFLKDIKVNIDIISDRIYSNITRDRDEIVENDQVHMYRHATSRGARFFDHTYKTIYYKSWRIKYSWNMPLNYDVNRSRCLWRNSKHFYSRYYDEMLSSIRRFNITKYKFCE